MSNSTDTQCNVLTTTYKDEQVIIIFVSSLIFGLVLLVIFFILRFFLWEFGKQNVYSWGKNKRTADYSETEVIQKNDDPTVFEVAREHTLFNWIINYFKLGLQEFRHRVGVDAYLYEIFQLHLLFLMSCYVIVCVAIILTVNRAYCSRDITITDSFITYTSISACILTGCSGSSDIVWLHSAMTHLLVFIGMLVSLNYRRILYRYEFKGRFHFNSILLINVPRPRSKCEAEDIKKSLCVHFRDTENEEDGPVSIEFAYDVAKYHALHKRHIEAEKNLHTYQELVDQYEVDQYIYPGVRRAVCWTNAVNAVDYYRFQSNELAHLKEVEKEKAMASPQNMVFITFREGFNVLSVYAKYLLFCRSPDSSQSAFLRQKRWQVKRAPAPTDINWDNIRNTLPQLSLWYIRWFIINLFILILLVFFTTPAAFFSILDIIIRSTGLQAHNATYTDMDKDGSINFIIDVLLSNSGLTNNTVFSAAKSLALAYAAPLLQILIASVIPLVVSYAAFLEFHWTKSDTMKAAILKTYIFLLIMLLIFPSFALVSFNVVLDLIVKRTDFTNGNESLIQFTNLTLIAFSPDTGIFFLNYLNISAFFVIIQIFQIPSLLMYLYRKLSARNEAESKLSHNSYTYYFKFGIEYAWVLVKITIAIVYGTLFPLITISGLLYLAIKMAVDRYNLIYQARPQPEFSGRISVHLRALRFLHASLILSQVYMVILSVILYGYNVTKIGLLEFNSIILALTILLLVGVQGFRWFQKYIYDFHLSMRTLFTRSYNAHLIHKQQTVKHLFNYFEFMDQDTVDTDSEDAKVV